MSQTGNDKHILLTPGEPAGIGPDIVLKIADESWPIALTVIADIHLLRMRAEQLGLKVEIKEINSISNHIHQSGQLNVLHVPVKSSVIPGVLDIKNAEYVIDTLKLAVLHAAKDPNYTALVTGPVQKSIIRDAGFDFQGHTEFLRDETHVLKTVMLFVLDQMRVALLTTHIPLKEVPFAITAKLLTDTIKIIHDDFNKKFKIANPRILICGLNPHAGEQGHLGREEIEVITPTIEKLNLEGYTVKGPYPADTIFTEKFLKEADVILALYHDQALPLVKYLAFSHAVNITLGLPFIRTSVDHGTALDLAGTNLANEMSLKSAMNLAIELLS